MAGWWLAGLVVAGMAWKLLCAYLRKRRSSQLATLDPREHCQALNASTLYVEFPFLSRLAIDFGLMRTFGIPSISCILAKSGQFACNASKRYDDMAILLEELALHHVDGPRGSLALRRMNFLHSHYPIQNSDYVYVLCLLILPPMELASMYGYRKWTKFEKAAFYNVWHDIGTRMGIQHIPSTIDGLSEYVDDYESKFMVYTGSNHETAEHNMKLLLNRFPTFLWPLARCFIYSLLDDRLRESLGYPKQPDYLRTFTQCLLKLHGLVTSCMPPRPLAWANTRISYGCPFANSSLDALLPLSFQCYKPIPYQKGYRIKNLGSLKPGKLANAFEGDLICSLETCSTLSLFDLLSKRHGPNI